MKHTYKDFVTGKIRYTRGKFLNWTEGGIIGAKYAVFATAKNYLLIPIYLLTAETRAAIKEVEGKS
jgi:hypothetical protein